VVFLKKTIVNIKTKISLQVHKDLLLLLWTFIILLNVYFVLYVNFINLDVKNLHELIVHIFVL